MMNKTIRILRAPVLQACCRRGAIVKRAARMLLMTLLLTMTVQTAWATDVTLSGSDNYTAQNDDVLTGSTSGTVTIAGGANVTLSDATITGGIVCEGTATITLIGTNSVTGKQYMAGIQVGGSGTTLTIKGAGSLAATGGAEAPGIGVSSAMNASVTGGDIVFEGGNITATGTGYGTGIGTGVCLNGTATIGNITFKGGTVKAIGGVYYSIIQVGIGKGPILSGGSAVVGTITIYDSIEMVDASSIGESVTYMHGETDVTANPSEYFTIGENGGQRIIVPKDDTEYTITIADGIEHGTLTGAATAKVLEKVTITATPGLGYIFSRLIVKDADNNDVATTGNSFIMPKSNVTVSAVFERGTHGTTSFLWNDFGDFDDMEQSNVYDGITTVSLKHGRTYQIEHYNGKYFILDNNTLTADIPYSAGTGAFAGYSAETATKFKLSDSAIEGFYDVTMTDVGNDKWSVSILKTVGQIDVIPDQTYTGSEITPKPLVLAGSLNLTEDTDYEYSYTDNTNVGTATVTVTFKGNYASIGSVAKTFTIVKATPTVTAPTPIEDLVYSGTAQALVTAGSTDFGTLLYSTDGENYSADIPTATDGGTYTVNYKVEGNNNWNAVDVQTVEVNIALALADAADNTAAITAHAGKTLAVALSGRTLYKDGSWNTLCLPFAVDLTASGTLSGDNVQAMTLNTETSDLTDGTLTLNFDAAETIPAGTPFIIKWDESGTDITNPVFEGVTIDADKHDATVTDVLTFTGTYALVTIDDDGDNTKLYLGSGNTLYYPNAAMTIGTHRAYFQLLGDLTAGNPASLVRAFVLNFGDDGSASDPTRIHAIDAGEGARAPHGWYTLDGCRLDGQPTAKGLYIHGGKKVVIK